MSKAKPIDRVEYTKSRTIRRTEDGKVIASVLPMTVDAAYDEERGVVVDRGTGAEVCPVCGTKILHEAGCVRCTACGWSRC